MSVVNNLRVSAAIFRNKINDWKNRQREQKTRISVFRQGNIEIRNLPVFVEIDDNGNFVYTPVVMKYVPENILLGDSTDSIMRRHYYKLLGGDPISPYGIVGVLNITNFVPYNKLVVDGLTDTDAECINMGIDVYNTSFRGAKLLKKK